MRMLIRRKEHDNKRKAIIEENISFGIIALLFFAIPVFVQGRNSPMYMVFYSMAFVATLFNVILIRKGEDENLSDICTWDAWYNFLLLFMCLGGAVGFIADRAQYYAVGYSIIIIINYIIVYQGVKKISEGKLETWGISTKKAINPGRVPLAILAFICFVIPVFIMERMSPMYMVFYALPLALVALDIILTRKGKEQSVLNLCGKAAVSFYILAFVLVEDTARYFPEGGSTAAIGYSMIILFNYYTIYRETNRMLKEKQEADEKA